MPWLIFINEVSFWSWVIALIYQVKNSKLTSPTRSPSLLLCTASQSIIFIENTVFKGVLHLWALFLKILCIFSKNKATSDKVSYGSGQKCSKELENYGSGGIEKSHSCKWAKWIQWHALPLIQQSTQQWNKGYYPNLHGWDFSIPPLPKLQFYFSRDYCCEVTVKNVRKSIFSMFWAINQ